MNAAVAQFRPGRTRPKAEFETITPAVATALLERNTHNRTLSQARVDRLADEMRHGAWDDDNGETIKIAVDGTVVDGQHRLWAVVESGVTIKSLVVRDVGRDAFKTVDIGKARTVGDMVGVAGIPSGNNVSAAATIVLMFSKKKLTLESHSSTKSFRRSEVTAYAIQHGPDLLESVRASVHHGTGKLLGPGPLAGCHYLFKHKSKHTNRAELADSFFKQLGEGLFDSRFPAERHPIRVLREKLIANRQSVSRLPTGTLIAYLIKTWNAYVSQHSLGVLRMTSGERFPTIA